jgi:hypothetical protein
MVNRTSLAAPLPLLYADFSPRWRFGFFESLLVIC